jgi:HTH-type transcriptional regulator/antitoxin HigA
MCGSRSAADHQAALAEAKRPWGANSGASAGDRLDILARLIDIYDSAHDPMDPPDLAEAASAAFTKS